MTSFGVKKKIREGTTLRSLSVASAAGQGRLLSSQQGRHIKVDIEFNMPKKNSI
jgi:hypothetical protein